MLTGGFEWIVILLILLLLFGGKYLPKLGKTFGDFINNMNKVSKEVKEEDKDEKGN